MTAVVPAVYQVPRSLRAAIDNIEIGPDADWAVIAGYRIEDTDRRVLRVRLSDAIYGTLHAGREIDPDQRLPRRIRDTEFERMLTENTPQRHFQVSVRVRELAQERPDGTTRILVGRDGVRMWVPVERIDTESYTAGDEVLMQASALRPAVSPGFFFVHGTTPFRRGPDLLRVYIHISDSNAAPRIWRRVLEFLEAREVSYRAKVLSSPLLYSRRDALVVYLAPQFDDVVTELAELVTGTNGTGGETSLFAERIAPGVSIAWEPRDPRPEMTGLSFGQHRASAIAGALLDAACGIGDLYELLTAEFIAAGIDPAHPARNLTVGRLPADTSDTEQPDESQR
ncbi:T3SS effector HopA1 family protein [Nocardia sp. KC 131]|uniref:T3SS effector HopA1 family protein n=1 Tax=Nocardia arseniciresistens TaxID=3392119 RepID=UPI00398EC49C